MLIKHNCSYQRVRCRVRVSSNYWVHYIYFNKLSIGWQLILEFCSLSIFQTCFNLFFRHSNSTRALWTSPCVHEHPSTSGPTFAGTEPTALLTPSNLCVRTKSRMASAYATEIVSVHQQCCCHVSQCITCWEMWGDAWSGVHNRVPFTACVE